MAVQTLIAPTPTQAEADALLDRLAAIPGRLAQAVAGWSDAQLHVRPTPDAWSARAVLAHMRASDEIIMPRISVLLASDNPTFPNVDERRLADIAYARLDFHQSLATFAHRRAELVAILRQIPLADWERQGTHVAYGRINIAYILKHAAWHEEDHCAQIERLHTVNK